jgi:iron complex outermembrane recepter protein
MQKLNDLPRPRHLSIWAIGILSVIMLVAPALATISTFEIEPQDLSGALKAFAVQSHREIFFAPELTRDRRSQGVKGKFDDLKALDMILEGTGLKFSITTSNAILVRDPDGKGDALRETVSYPSIDDANSKEAGKQNSPDLRVAEMDQAPAGSQLDKAKREEPKKKNELDEIIVTGTHIKGEAPVGSSLKSYTREDFARSGVATLEQFARYMPENLSTLDTISQFAPNPTGLNASGDNQVYGAGFNLHGLGAGATLTLLNGHRVTAAGGDGSFVDTSLIPLSAIDRVEVLTDGASAIYGSDAIAGVVNIILRQDFQGLETTLRYGGTTRGGAGQFTGSQVAGETWATGDVMAVYEFDRQGGLDASQRDFIPDPGGPSSLVPSTRRNSVFVTARQEVASQTTLLADGFFSDKHFGQMTASLGTLQSGQGNSKEYGGTLELRQDLGEDWTAHLSGTYTHLTQPSENLVPAFAVAGNNTFDSHLAVAELGATGSVFDLPAGDVKVALGAEYRADAFALNELTFVSGTQVSDFSEQLSRRAWSAYAEAIVPLLGENGRAPGMKQLELSVAGRYDHYSDFGSTTNPKVGVRWTPYPGMSLRATYSTSFHAPLLTQLASTPLYFAFDLGNPHSSTGVTDTLVNESGGNPNLLPERAHSYSFGLDVAPEWIPRLTFSASYFHVVFSNRITPPPIVGSIFDIYQQTSALLPFFNFSPNPAETAALFNGGNVIDVAGHGPGGVQAYFDVRNQNIAQTRQSGIDLSASYQVTLLAGDLGFNLSGMYWLKDDFQTVSTLSPISILNTISQPVRVRVNGGVTWSDRGFGTALTSHYWGSYTNPLFSPPERISSWTTTDLQLSYGFPHTETHGALRDLKVALTVQNLWDAAPPRAHAPAGQFDAGFDPANANPFGRMISIQLTKDWGQ